MRIPHFTCESSELPFSGFRAFLQTFDEPFRSELWASMPVLSHGQKKKSRSVSVKSRIRYWHRSRCLVAARAIGWRLADAYPKGLHITLQGTGNRADADFFEEISTFAPVTIERQWSTDRFENLDQDLRQVLADREWIKTEFDAEGDWTVFRRRIRRYLSSGDAWTLEYLGGFAMQTEHRLDAETADLFGLASQLLERPLEADSYYREASAKTDDPIVTAGLFYSRAILWGRHVAKPMRDLDYASSLLEDGEELLEEIRTEGVRPVAWALNRNGQALVKFFRGHLTEAESLLESSLGQLGNDDDNAAAKAIMLHNLARIHIRNKNVSRAIELLKESVALEVDNPEAWSELAYLLIEEDDFGGALSAVRQAETVCTWSARIPAVLGFLHARSGDHREAAAAYARSVLLAPDRAENVLSLIRQLCLSGQHTEALQWTARVPDAGLQGEESVECKLLELEARSFVESMTEDAVVERLKELAVMHPDSEIVKDNINAIQASALDPLPPERVESGGQRKPITMAFGHGPYTKEIAI
ncbi:tetratricopeptide repeat protein [Salininema proteolyticum]|uniref:Tetratricopeptide repeat protein n=1 Tax=Salininema proteolyticum TaxID=1607685 RepID=A0ABV8TWM8_9ACTN